MGSNMMRERGHKTMYILEGERGCGSNLMRERGHKTLYIY